MPSPSSSSTSSSRMRSRQGRLSDRLHRAKAHRAWASTMATNNSSNGNNGSVGGGGGGQTDLSITTDSTAPSSTSPVDANIVSGSNTLANHYSSRGFKQENNSHTGSISPKKQRPSPKSLAQKQERVRMLQQQQRQFHRQRYSPTKNILAAAATPTTAGALETVSSPLPPPITPTTTAAAAPFKRSPRYGSDAPPLQQQRFKSTSPSTPPAQQHLKSTSKWQINTRDLSPPRHCDDDDDEEDDDLVGALHHSTTIMPQMDELSPVTEDSAFRRNFAGVQSAFERKALPQPPHPPNEIRVIEKGAPPSTRGLAPWQVEAARRKKAIQSRSGLPPSPPKVTNASRNGFNKTNITAPSASPPPKEEKIPVKQQSPPNASGTPNTRSSSTMSTTKTGHNNNNDNDNKKTEVPKRTWSSGRTTSRIAAHWQKRQDHGDKDNNNELQSPDSRESQEDDDEQEETASVPVSVEESNDAKATLAMWQRRKQQPSPWKQTVPAWKKTQTDTSQKDGETTKNEGASSVPSWKKGIRKDKEASWITKKQDTVNKTEEKAEAAAPPQDSAVLNSIKNAQPPWKKKFPNTDDDAKKSDTPSSWNNRFQNSDGTKNKDAPSQWNKGLPKKIEAVSTNGNNGGSPTSVKRNQLPEVKDEVPNVKKNTPAPWKKSNPSSKFQTGTLARWNTFARDKHGDDSNEDEEADYAPSPENTEDEREGVESPQDSKTQHTTMSSTSYPSKTAPHNPVSNRLSQWQKGKTHVAHEGSRIKQQSSSNQELSDATNKLAPWQQERLRRLSRQAEHGDPPKVNSFSVPKVESTAERSPSPKDMMEPGTMPVEQQSSPQSFVSSSSETEADENDELRMVAQAVNLAPWQQERMRRQANKNQARTPMSYVSTPKQETIIHECDQSVVSSLSIPAALRPPPSHNGSFAGTSSRSPLQQNVISPPTKQMSWQQERLKLLAKSGDDRSVSSSHKRRPTNIDSGIEDSGKKLAPWQQERLQRQAMRGDHSVSSTPYRQSPMRHRENDEQSERGTNATSSGHQHSQNRAENEPNIPTTISTKKKAPSWQKSRGTNNENTEVISSRKEETQASSSNWPSWKRREPLRSSPQPSWTSSPAALSSPEPIVQQASEDEDEDEDELRRTARQPHREFEEKFPPWKRRQNDITVKGPRSWIKSRSGDESQPESNNSPMDPRPTTPQRSAPSSRRSSPVRYMKSPTSQPVSPAAVDWPDEANQVDGNSSSPVRSLASWQNRAIADSQSEIGGSRPWQTSKPPRPSPSSWQKHRGTNLPETTSTTRQVPAWQRNRVAPPTSVQSDTGVRNRPSWIKPNFPEPSEESEEPTLTPNSGRKSPTKLRNIDSTTTTTTEESVELDKKVVSPVRTASPRRNKSPWTRRQTDSITNSSAVTGEKIKTITTPAPRSGKKAPWQRPQVWEVPSTSHVNDETDLSPESAKLAPWQREMKKRNKKTVRKAVNVTSWIKESNEDSADQMESNQPVDPEHHDEAPEQNLEASVPEQQKRDDLLKSKGGQSVDTLNPISQVRTVHQTFSPMRSRSPRVTSPIKTFARSPSPSARKMSRTVSDGSWIKRRVAENNDTISAPMETKSDIGPEPRGASEETRSTISKVSAQSLQLHSRHEETQAWLKDKRDELDGGQKSLARSCFPRTSPRAKTQLYDATEVLEESDKAVLPTTTPDGFPIPMVHTSDKVETADQSFDASSDAKSPSPSTPVGFQSPKSLAELAADTVVVTDYNQLLQAEQDDDSVQSSGVAKSTPSKADLPAEFHQFVAQAESNASSNSNESSKLGVESSLGMHSTTGNNLPVTEADSGELDLAYRSPQRVGLSPIKTESSEQSTKDESQSNGGSSPLEFKSSLSLESSNSRTGTDTPPHTSTSQIFASVINKLRNVTLDSPKSDKSETDGQSNEQEDIECSPQFQQDAEPQEEASQNLESILKITSPRESESKSVRFSTEPDEVHEKDQERGPDFEEQNFDAPPQFQEDEQYFEHPPQDFQDDDQQFGDPPPNFFEQPSSNQVQITVFENYEGGGMVEPQWASRDPDFLPIRSASPSPDRPEKLELPNLNVAQNERQCLSPEEAFSRMSPIKSPGVSPELDPSSLPNEEAFLPSGSLSLSAETSHGSPQKFDGPDPMGIVASKEWNDVDPIDVFTDPFWNNNLAGSFDFNEAESSFFSRDSDSPPLPGDQSPFRVVSLKPPPKTRSDRTLRKKQATENFGKNFYSDTDLRHNGSYSVDLSADQSFPVSFDPPAMKHPPQIRRQDSSDSDEPPGWVQHEDGRFEV